MQTLDIKLQQEQKAYFLSDFHLGTPSYQETRERERRIVAWIDAHRADMGALFLLGDVFDYWFEYLYTMPKGNIRLLGKLAELTDAGVPVYFFCGNHDAWHIDFFEKELGIKVMKDLVLTTINGCRFVLGHGDGLGAGQHGYKLMKKVFSARISSVLYAAVHPYLAQKFASNFSHRSRQSGIRNRARERDKNRILVGFMRDFLKHEPVDAFIFAHRHWPVLVELLPPSGTEDNPDDTRACRENLVRLRDEHGMRVTPCHPVYLNTGDWLQYFSYGAFDGKILSLHGQNLKTEL